jgi:quinol monooxygenase YgiN
VIANFVVFQLKPGTRSQFLDASLDNSRGSINGPGCLATTILPDPRRDDVAYVFEVFADQKSFDNHHDQRYYKKWIADTSDLLARPYQLLQSTTFPDDDSFRHLRLAVCGDPDPTVWTAS